MGRNMCRMLGLVLVVLLVFFAALPSLAQTLTPSQVFQKVEQSVFVVKTFDARGTQKGQGSGVLIPDGRIATNCHVVAGGTSFQVGRGDHFISATLYGGDDDLDICILEVKGIKGTPAQIGKAGNLSVGDSVYAVGAPYGLELSLSSGIVSQLRGGPPPMIQTTAAISPGSSGGGLFDSQGRLVGLTTLYVEGGQSLNFAMPVEWIAEVKPGHKVVAKDRHLMEWVMGAAALESAKDWQGLLNWCQQWTKRYPESALAWATLGNTYDDLNRHHEAIEAYREALRANPEYAAAWSDLGSAFGALGRHQEAIDAHRRAIRINPALAGAWFNLGNVYFHLNRHQDAIDGYRQAVRIDPRYVSAWYNLGFVYSSLNRHQDAIDAYRQAIRIDPEYSRAWGGLGTCYFQTGRDQDAIDAFRQAIRFDPELVGGWVGLAIAYYSAGNRSAALDVVRELRRLDPDSAEYLFNMMQE